MKKVKRFHWLEKMINSNKFTIGVEIGTATGITTEYLLTHCPGIKKYFVADDWRPVGTPGHPWSLDNMEEVFRKKFKGEKRIEMLKGLSWEVASSVEDGSLDWAFVDASHDKESVKKDLDAWTSKVKKGGIMCGHDINTEGVRQAVEEKFGEYEDVGVDHVWLVRV